MAFYKKQKLNGKWYPRAVTKGHPFTTDDVAKKLSEMSTVTPGDTYAVLMNLGPVLAQMMAMGSSVKLKGMGTFYLTCQSGGQGVDTPEEVTAAQITDVRVRFIPEYARGYRGQIAERTLIYSPLEWVNLDNEIINTNK